MKKIFRAMVMVLMVIPAACANAFGGFVDAENNIVSVDEALRLPDKSFVVLQGSILKRLTADEYVFSDNISSVVVEIDSEKWRGKTVNPASKVEISGEIDKDFRNVKIDVEDIKIIQK